MFLARQDFRRLRLLEFFRQFDHLLLRQRDITSLSRPFRLGYSFLKCLSGIHNLFLKVSHNFDIALPSILGGTGGGEDRIGLVMGKGCQKPPFEQ